MNPDEILTQIANEVTVCKNCSLHETRKRAVPGEGPSNAEIMFIGEGPGFNENEQGRPFVGAAGKLLSDLLAKAGLERKDVFICNVVKCRPPENRDPLPDEIFACGKYLDRQIEAINPRVIVTLGRISMSKFFPEAKISSIHGKAKEIDGKLIVAMYHPAAALHQPNLRPALESDFAGLKTLLRPTPIIQKQEIIVNKPTFTSFLESNTGNVAETKPDYEVPSDTQLNLF